MGLFDTITCEYPLPLPELAEEDLGDFVDEEGEPLDWKTVEWQTKSLENVLDSYSIEEDGQVYKRAANWTKDDEDDYDLTPDGFGELEKYENTGEIFFYNVVLGENHDHWLEFKVVLWKGEVKEIELVDYKKEDNSERVAYRNMWRESVEVERLLTTKWWYSSFIFYRRCMQKIFKAIRWCLASLINFAAKIERWIT